MEQTVSAIINKRTYRVKLFNPIAAYRFYYEFIQDRESSFFGMQALRRCIAPDGIELSGDNDFTVHFTRYPEDMLPLQKAALCILLMDFQSEVARYLKQRGELFKRLQKRQTGIPIPEGWDAYSFFGRVINAGLCTYDKLLDGTMTIKDVFEMQRILDWKDYCHAVMLEKHAASAMNKNRRK